GGGRSCGASRRGRDGRSGGGALGGPEGIGGGRAGSRATDGRWTLGASARVPRRVARALKERARGRVGDGCRRAGGLPGRPRCGRPARTRGCSWLGRGAGAGRGGRRGEPVGGRRGGASRR